MINQTGKKNILIGSLLSLMILTVGCGGAQIKEQSTETGSSGGAEAASEADKAETVQYQYTDFVMDTVLSETLYTTGKDRTKEIQDRLSALEEEELSWREEDSEVAQLNEAFQEGKAFTMTRDFADWTAACLTLAKNSDGAFDPTIGQLTRLWNIEEDNPTVPAETEIEACLSLIGYENVKIDEKDSLVISAEGAYTLDLGAVGKGIACDEAAAYLEEQKEISGAVIAVGGSILTYGEKDSGEPWRVAVQDPDTEAEEGAAMGVLTLEGTHYVSTSGDYEKYFEQDGKRYHHILDPATGYPSESDLASVTVVCDSGLLSDGLSTACFVLGSEKAEALLEKYGAEGIFIDHQGKVTVTEGLEESFEILEDSYTK